MCIVVVSLGLFNGCEQELDIPPAPVAPSAAQWARTFQEPMGTLTQDRQIDLIDWALSSGGAGALVGLLIGDLLLSQWLAPLEGDTSSTPDNQSNEDQGSEITEGLQIDGWAQLDLPCSSGTVSLNLLLSQSGIHPVVWGDLSECAYPDLGIYMDMSITIFVPNLYSPTFSNAGWGPDEPQGLWLWIQGKLEYDGYMINIDTALEISSTNNRTATLYESEGARFIVLLDETLNAETLSGNLEELLSTLSFGLETEDATWFCSVESGTCMEMSR